MWKSIKIKSNQAKTVQHKTSLQHSIHSGRRQMAIGWMVSMGIWRPTPSVAIPLAPLGKVKQQGDKRTNLGIEEVKEILKADIRDGKYFINPSGLTKEIFADDCRFIDPTNDVTGLSRYLRALELLFDTSRSNVELIDIEIQDDKHIAATWTLGGYLKFPWDPCVKTYTGKALYTLNDQGLIQSQEQEWSKSAAEALRESFTPCAK